MNRLAYTIGLICLSPILPWWALAGVALLAFLLFTHYWEVIVIFFVYDLAFGLPDAGLLKSQFSFTVIFVVTYFLIESYKDRLRL